MNTPTATPINFAALSVGIAAALPGAWSVSPIEEYPRSVAEFTLTRADGLKLYAVASGYGNPGRIKFALSRPRDNGASGGGWVDVWEPSGGGSIADPSITVADGKTAAQMAADIARRLIPEAERVFALVNERITASNAYRDGRATLAKQIADALGHGPNTGSHIAQDADPVFRLDSKGGNGYGSARVNSGESVSFEINSMPAAKAVALAAWLRANVFPA